MMKTNLWLKLTGSTKTLFQLQLTIALYYSDFVIHTLCTGRFFSPSKQKEKKITVLIYLWFWQPSRKKEWHTNWVAMPQLMNQHRQNIWENSHLNDFGRYVITQFPNWLCSKLNHLRDELDTGNLIIFTDKNTCLDLAKWYRITRTTNSKR